MSTPKGWTSYTGGIYSIEIPVRDSSQAHSEFRETKFQDSLKPTASHKKEDHPHKAKDGKTPQSKQHSSKQ